MFYILIFIIILIYLFLVVNSIIWIRNKNMININDKIVKYIIYMDFIIYSSLLLLLVYIYFNNYSIKIF